MRKIQSKTIASIGFLITILVLFIFLMFWMRADSLSRESFKAAELTYAKNTQLFSLIHLQSLRSHNLQMLLQEANEDRKKKILEAIHQATSDIISFSNQIFILETPVQKSNNRNKFHESFSRFSELQNKIIVLDSNDSAERKVLMNLYESLDNRILLSLQSLAKKKETDSRNLLNNAMHGNQQLYYSVIILGMVALLLGVLNVFVVRKSVETEDALLRQGMRIRLLYEITSKPGLSTEEQIREILKVGCYLLGMQIAKVCKLSKKENTNSFLNVYAPEGFNVCAGTVMPLDKTFCSIVLEEDAPIALNDVSNSIYKTRFSHLAAYTAIKLAVNGEIYGSVDFSSNITRQEKFTESDVDLLKLIGSWISATLERRFAQEDLVIAKNDAESASRTKSSFLANMSHELRTPLNAIIGYSELIKEEAGYNNHSMYDKDLHVVNSSALHLLALIDDILDLSKIESGKMEYYMESFSIAELVTEVSETITPLMDMKNNKFSVVVVDDIGVMHSDRLKIKQVLLNILSNASKFTEDGKVVLNVRFNHKNLDMDGLAKEVLFIVKDTGIGISDEQISKIFYAFSQAEVSTTSKYGGTGLGLAISRQICQLLGGDIHVKGALGQGTSFTVTMPLKLSA